MQWVGGRSATSRTADRSARLAGFLVPREASWSTAALRRFRCEWPRSADLPVRFRKKHLSREITIPLAKAFTPAFVRSVVHRLFTKNARNNASNAINLNNANNICFVFLPVSRFRFRLFGCCFPPSVFRPLASAPCLRAPVVQNPFLTQKLRNEPKPNFWKPRTHNIFRNIPAVAASKTIPSQQPRGRRVRSRPNKVNQA